MHEHCGTISRKDEIWPAGHSPDVESISKSGLKKPVAQRKFWGGVLTADASHHPTAHLARHDINHS